MPQAHNTVLSQTETETLMDSVEERRVVGSAGLDANLRSELGQFMTPASTARLMADMFSGFDGDIRLLDAGAGVGSLTAAVAERMVKEAKPPRSVALTCYEIESALSQLLEDTLGDCVSLFASAGIKATSLVRTDNFIEASTRMLSETLLESRHGWNRIIINPPYAKINSDSQERMMLRRVGVEVSNLYAAFVALSIMMLDEGGEIVAITPRSFCNGPYFRQFRQHLLAQVAIKRIHVFHSRNKAFRSDNVLQENVIIHAVKGASLDKVLITSSTCADSGDIEEHRVASQDVSAPSDPQAFIHIPASVEEGKLAHHARSLPCSLDALNLSVSTGRVVDFRAQEHLRMEPNEGCVPLLYPKHFDEGGLRWPIPNGKKPNAIVLCDATLDLMVPNGNYVLVKRFTAKEERKRVVATVCGDTSLDAEYFGFENHLNYFHRGGQGLEADLARGLALFLNSSLVDRYFRQFNGHTQVNATDLRSLMYPRHEQLIVLGRKWQKRMPKQAIIDGIVDEMLCVRI